MTPVGRGSTPGRRLSPLAAPGRPRLPAADARALYLVPDHVLHVSSTGEALVVARPDGDLHRFPVARLLRVVCSERVNWSGAALGLCQQRGIAVTWLDGRGSAIGHLWPSRAPGTRLADAMEALAGQPGDWSDVYDNWLRRQRLAVLRRWADERAAAARGVPADEWQRALRAWVYRDEIAQHLPAVVHGLISALVASRLAAMGLSPAYWCVSGYIIELAHDVSRLIWAELNLCGGAIAQAMQDTRQAAALFEQWSVRCADLAHSHLASLQAVAARELRA